MKREEKGGKGTRISVISRSTSAEKTRASYFRKKKEERREFNLPYQEKRKRKE